MRILMLCPQFRPIVGGYERAAERLSAELVRRGCEVTLLAERRDRGWPSRESMAGFQVRRLYTRYRPRWHMPTSLITHALWLLCRGRRFDVWHVHQYGSHATMAVLLGQLLRRPVVLKLTSTAEQGLRTAIREGHWRALQVWAHRRVAACIAVSDEAVGEAQAFGIPGLRVHRIGNGVDVDLFRPATPEQRRELRARLGLPDRPVALFVGRLATEKDPLGMIRAWREAGRLGVNGWLLAMVGDGPVRSDVEAAIAADEAQAGVFLAGTQRAVEDWYRAADLFVLSSRNEGLPNTVLEAMACGLPVVATRVSSIRQLVEEPGAGLAVPHGDMKALATAIVRLARDDEMRQAMGIRARRVIEQQYAIAEVTRRHIAMYRSLVRA